MSDTPRTSVENEHVQGALLRDFEAGVTLENFMIAAIASILAIRLFLHITGYPQIGGRGLHIAHLLWGGLLMLAAIVILISFLDRGARRLATILGGTGFGMFIDEVGKFVTSDNNYFFRPAVSIMYVTFVLLFLAVRSIHVGRNRSKQECLANALRQLTENATFGLDKERKELVLTYLEQSDPRNPLVEPLKKTIGTVAASPDAKPWFMTRLSNRLKSRYAAITQHRLFTTGIVTLFVADIAIKTTYVLFMIFFFRPGWDRIFHGLAAGRLEASLEELSFVDWAGLLPSLVSGALTFVGVFTIRHSRLFAFQMFERSILVSLLVTQVFMFYKEQFSALAGLAVNILVLGALRFMIAQEKAGAIGTIGYGR